MEARKRKDGKEHIALIVDILWQIWKSRNDREFKDQGRHPMKVIQRAQREWEEYRALLDQSHHMSKLETSEPKDFDQIIHEELEIVTLHFLAGPHLEGQNMGIGVLATN